jgi:hypothetical protein
MRIMKRHYIRYLVVLWALLLLLTVSINATIAQAAPSLRVNPIWLPGQQLTSRADLSDPRTVDLQVFVTGNTQFWAVDMICQFGTSAELKTPVITWGPDWGISEINFVAYSPPGNFTNGIYRVSASRLGATTKPLGINGSNYNLLLFTITFNVADLEYPTAVYPYCYQANFLNRNGEISVYGYQEAYDLLTINVGYSIRGKATRQGNVYHHNIEVRCTNLNTNHVFTALTDYYGNYTLGGAYARSLNPLRELGTYSCEYQSKITGNEDKQYLHELVLLNLSSPDFYLMPVTLKAGDVNSVASPDLIDNHDFSMVTSNWAGAAYLGANAAGDVQGDGYINQVDLAIVTGNVTLGDAPPLRSGRVGYGMARDYDATFPNSHIWWGAARAGAVQLWVPATYATRDFWPAVSPNGKEVVYTGLGLDNQHRLFVSSAEYPGAVPLTPYYAFTKPSFAPSWSTDGKRIAFICSWKDAVSGYEYNEGDVCVMNRGDALGTTLTTIGTKAKIYPPAWVNDTTLIYAGLPSNTLCPNKLCFYDIERNQSGVVPLSAVSGANRADMPVIQQHPTGQYLFYRYYDNGATAYTVRVGTVSYSAGVFTGGVTGALVNGSHEVVDNTTGVDYYAVSPSLDVMFYTFNALEFRNLIQTALGSNFTWDPPAIHYVDGFTGNPNSVIGTNFLWDGNLSNPTLLHAYRATFDWMP